MPGDLLQGEQKTTAAGLAPDNMSDYPAGLSGFPGTWDFLS